MEHIPPDIILIAVAVFGCLALVQSLLHRYQRRNASSRATQSHSEIYEFDSPVWGDAFVAAIFAAGIMLIWFYPNDHAESPPLLIVAAVVGIIVYRPIRSILRRKLVRWNDDGIILTFGPRRYSTQASPVNISWLDIYRINVEEGAYILAIGGQPESNWIKFGPKDLKLIAKLHQMRPDLVDVTGKPV